ncbi:periplasmic heavy metal sensor [Variovorax sp. JS1663]|uniref:periplasmic heavy metal sensor n=1 Tax=Variovorax sp. JS1663 TaxID=1851577 RepID=UPI000B343768|nr:periplasmic heavy metal sensor [Variovorax sp. JS1663]OUL98759.1 hypothetical protein A8M77_29900 [Variovorax sp. JS1663]
MSGERSFKGWAIASIALNIFLMGGIAGGAWRWWTTHEPAEPAAPAAQAAQATPAAPRGLRFAADALAPAQRQAFRTGLRDLRRESADLVQASREGRLEAARLLAAPTLDRGAAEAALARTRAADVALRERVEAHVLRFADTLSPAERATFVQGLSTQGNLRVPPAPPRP